MKRLLIDIEPTLLVVFLTFWTGSCFGLSSFNEIKQQIYQTPQNGLPEYPGLSPYDIVENFVGNVHSSKSDFIVRSRRTLVDESDYREPAPKWIHVKGVCAEAEWEIIQDSGATGLFKKGTRVPAIIRFSSGTSDSVYVEKGYRKGDEGAGFITSEFSGRIFGFALKLFPTTDPNKMVKTKNIFTLDQAGFDRSFRGPYFHSDKYENEEVYFTNVAPADSFLGKILSSFFDRFDNPNWARPLYAAAAIEADSDIELPERVTPYEIRFQASKDFKAPDWYHYQFIRGDEAKNKRMPSFHDFRDELRNYKAVDIKLDIILQSFDGKNILAKKIGQLRVGKPVVSVFCDQRLHFHHHPNEDQLEKYDNYDAVLDLIEE